MASSYAGICGGTLPVPAVCRAPCDAEAIKTAGRFEAFGGMRAVILTDNEMKIDLLNNEAIAKTIIELLRENRLSDDLELPHLEASRL
jgi:hypothetical protein